MDFLNKESYETVCKGGFLLFYREIFGDLFKVRSEYVLAHCISTDCEMGKGIAVEFVKRNPNMKSYLLAQDPQIGQAIYYPGDSEHQVFNLVTKRFYNGKPKRKDFNQAIESLKNEMVQRGLMKLAIPIMGSGLDKLNWVQSSRVIQEVFADTHIQIFVIHDENKKNHFGGR